MPVSMFYHSLFVTRSLKPNTSNMIFSYKTFLHIVRFLLAPYQLFVGGLLALIEVLIGKLNHALQQWCCLKNIFSRKVNQIKLF